MKKTKDPHIKWYNFEFKFRYFIPGGLSPMRTSTYCTVSQNYAEAVNDFNAYCHKIFHGAVTITLTSIRRLRIKKDHI